MKKTLVLLAVVGLLGSVASRADDFSGHSATAPIKKGTPRHKRLVVYITNVPVTGSHLPLVVARYGNDLRSTSSFTAYSQPQLDQTGQLDVSSELIARDPSISGAFGKH